MKTIHSLIIISGLALILPNTVNAKPLCPSQNFNQFLKAFENNVSIQKRFTKNPLQWRSYTDSYEVPTTVFKSVKNITWPIMLNATEQKSQSLSVKTKTLNSGGKKVFVGSVDGDDYIMNYYFYRQSGCWQLKRVDDLSLNN